MLLSVSELSYQRLTIERIRKPRIEGEAGSGTARFCKQINLIYCNYFCKLGMYFMVLFFYI